MNKYGVYAFRAGEEIPQLSLGAADYRIIYVDRSALNIIVQQEKIKAVAGNVVIIRLTKKQIQLIGEPDFEGFVLEINNSTAATLVKRYLLLMNATERDISIFTVVKQEQEIRMVFQNIIAELHGELEPSDMILNLLLEELLVRLYRVTPKVYSGVQSNRAEIVSSIRTLLETEYRRPFTLGTIAEKYNMSISYLSHIFKEITGVSLMRYLLEIRIRAAQEYLTQTSLPINEIAERCGFNDLSNFGRTFQKETGYSPRRYRSLKNHKTET